MIEIRLTATEFNEFVFDDVTQQTVPADMVPTALRLVQELSDPSKTRERPLSPEEKARAAAAGRKLWPGRKLRGDEATFTLSADERALLLALLENATARHPLLVLPDFDALLGKVRDAPEIKDKAKADAA